MYDFCKGGIMEINYKKTILSTIALTLTVLVVISLIVFCLMYFVFTKSFADFCYSLGSKNFASNLYYKVYEKNDDIYYCYRALNIKIVLDKVNDVVKYYKEFESDNEYSDFMDYLNKKNEQVSASLIEKSVLLNEDNYLKRNFIKALIDTNRVSEAFDYSIEYFSEYDNFDFFNQGAYTLNYFVSSSEKFDVIYDKYDVKLVAAMQNYFDNSYLIFDEKKDCTLDLEKSYLIALGNRLIQVGEDLNKLYNELGGDSVSKNNEVMTSINDTLKGVI